jgi:hypothetical protein
MKKKTLKVLYWMAWVVGVIAALTLLYGIIITIFN